MRRRLYYLFPDAVHAQTLDRELSSLAVPGVRVHAVVDKTTPFTGTMDVQHVTTEIDQDTLLEWRLWRLNLGIFFLALPVFVGMLVFAPSWYLVIPLMIMVVCFATGASFALHVPNVHRDEFNHAVHHGEVLMMVDVPSAELNKVDHHIHRLHPEAVSGGVGWAA